jgi:hypothetical protein
VAEMLGVQPGLLQPFAVADPFHDGLPLEGFLCQKTDHRYGAIMITRVGEEPCPQLIHATPKLRYPFDRDGRFRFPPITRAHTNDCIAAVRAELDFRGRVVAAYEAIRAEGLSFPADKAAVMRLLAPRFTKNEMPRVYAAVVAATA